MMLEAFHWIKAHQPYWCAALAALRHAARAWRWQLHGCVSARVPAAFYIATVARLAAHCPPHPHACRNRRGGRDHIWLSVHDEGSCWVPAAIRPSIILSHWGRMDANHTSGTAYGADYYRCDAVLCVVQCSLGVGQGGQLGNPAPATKCCTSGAPPSHRSSPSSPPSLLPYPACHAATSMSILISSLMDF